MHKLLEEMEHAEFRKPDGTALCNSLEWVMLRSRIAEMLDYAIEAHRIVKMVEAQRA